VARLTRGMSVLEPSAGNGAIVEQLPTEIGLAVTAVELISTSGLRSLLAARFGTQVVEQDFLRWKPGQVFDVAIMNPPYSSQDGADGLHVAHALRCAKRVVALVRTNFMHGVQRYHQVFRWCRVLSITVLVRRPKFTGPANQGDSARHDYQILELERRVEERQPGHRDFSTLGFLV